MKRVLLFATLFLVACAPTPSPSPTPTVSPAPSFSGAPSPSPIATDVVGNLGGGGPVVLSRAGDMQFEQDGQVVASTKADDAGVFEIRLPPGAYDVVVTNFPGGCEGTHHITVYGSRQELTIQCNNKY